MAKTIKELECLKCGHTWFPRSLERPAVCPKCKNPRWDRGAKKFTRPSSQEENKRGEDGKC